MNLDELCNEISGEETVKRVMLPWENRHSPLVYWAQQLTGKSMWEDKPSVETTINDEGREGTSLEYGLPTWEINKVCKQKYRNDVVKVTLQIAVPESMQIKRDLRVTFSDQIGVIGKMGSYYCYDNLRT